MRNDNSLRLFEEARKYIPGGVNTSIRMLDPPIVFTKARGSKIYDADGNEYIDYHAAFGPPILGHNNPEVNQRVKEIMNELDLIGVGTAEIEIRAAELIVKHVPSIEKVLFCNSGSEATYHAVRLARAVTGRKKLIKFQGCYHGWHDYLLMNVISPPDKIGKKDPLSAGMLPEAIENTIVVDFNDLEGVERVVKSFQNEVAAIILEPIQHNIGCVLPTVDFLKGLREISDREDIVLIFDEVITGFRHSIGGYQKIAGVIPDITTLGKAMANGYPLAAIGGRSDLMDRFNTRLGGDVFFAGTYNAHPISLAACIATIEKLEDERVYQHIFRLGETMRQGLADITEELGIRAYTTGFGSVFVTYFMEPPVKNYTDLLRNDVRLFVEYRKRMIAKGIFMLPLNLKRNHISAVHTEEEIKFTLDKSREALKEVSNKYI